MTRTIVQQNGSGACAGGFLRRNRWVKRIGLLPIGALAVASVAVSSSEADAGSGLAGSWSGGGWVSFSNGNKEKARCRASYSAASANSYHLTATCATSSGKASQTATVYKVSNTSYKGSFYNPDYNVRGVIRVNVHGSSQSVSLAGEGASASLSLRRR
jgi:hypothetical protein